MADAVLIVEDDASTRELIAQTLHLEGFAPIATSNGEDALRYLRSGGPAKIILLDLMMPAMDGWTFRRRQRADPRLANIPVVVVTAGTLEGVDELDVDLVLRKPILLDELIRIVRELCRQRPART